MKLINFGSLNIDKVYSVKNTVKEGETIFASNYEIFTGGKGLNQSVAASRAGMKVRQAGALGPDGTFLRNYLSSSNVDVSGIFESKKETGHAIIQVNESGQNSIVVFGGANRDIPDNYVDTIINQADKDDIVLLQNETNNVERIIRTAHQKGLTVAWNPSPFTEEISTMPSDLVNIFFVNEIEGALLAETDSDDFEAIIKKLAEKFPNAMIVLTLGSRGVLCLNKGKLFRHSVYKVKAVDTTGAGDTFTGYFLCSLSEGLDIGTCLDRACAASAIAVSRNGAAPAIPTKEEVLKFLENNSDYPR